MTACTASHRCPPLSNTRRTLLAFGAFAALLGSPAARAQPNAAEAALRDAIARYDQAWNRHDVDAWAGFLTEDVAYTDVYAWGDTGRTAAIAKYRYNVETQDLKWEVVRIRMVSPGSATVVMRTEFRVLPLTDGNYKSVFRDYPAISRWRLENGQWRMFFFTSFAARGTDIVKKEGLE